MMGNYRQAPVAMSRGEGCRCGTPTGAVTWT